LDIDDDRNLSRLDAKPMPGSAVRMPKRPRTQRNPASSGDFFVRGFYSHLPPRRRYRLET
jgi:hypothetical protein